MLCSPVNLFHADLILRPSQRQHEDSSQGLPPGQYKVNVRSNEQGTQRRPEEFLGETILTRFGGGGGCTPGNTSTERQGYRLSLRSGSAGGFRGHGVDQFHRLED